MRFFGPETAWPPLPVPIISAMKEWDSWYRGEPNTVVHSRPSILQRWGVARNTSFWGAHENPRRPRLHMPLAADIATASADLLFGEELDIQWDDAAARERMAYVLDGCGIQSMLLEAAETAAAVGGVYLRAGWDTSVADHPMISVVGQDGVIPTFRWGRLAEAVVWHVVRAEGGEVWRHLEHHEPGRIHHRLHRGTDNLLGGQVPLDSIPATQGLPEEVPTGISRLTVAHVPNVKPVSVWRDEPLGRDLGRSDFGARGVLGFLDALDEAWSSWMRDLRLGKARIMVATTMLDSAGPGAGAVLDIDKEVYEGFRFGQPESASLSDMLQAQQFAIRTTEHAATVDALMGVVVRSCGYSGSTFGLTTDVTKTATEVNSVDRRSSSTRERKTRYWTSGLRSFLTMLSELDSALFRQAPPSEARVTFPPESQPSEMDKAQAIQAFRAAQVMSIETGVRLAQPDLGDSEVREEVSRIMEENAASAPRLPEAVIPDEMEDDDQPPAE